MCTDASTGLRSINTSRSSMVGCVSVTRQINAYIQSCRVILKIGIRLKLNRASVHPAFWNFTGTRYVI